jgi:hypothetical protein
MTNDCPWWPFAMCRTLVRRWNLRPGPWLAAYDPDTDEFVFQVPGESEPLRFRPHMIYDEQGPVKRWAVGMLAGM